jgi:hypothetical protein
MWEISNWIQAKSTGRVALAALALFVAFASTVLPAQSSAAAAASQGVGSPDLSLVYSPAVLYHMAERYGPDGRTAYIRARASFDVIWPAVYLVFLTTAISWLYGKAASDRHRWQLGNLLPVGAVALDLMENLSTSIVMIRFPAIVHIHEVGPGIGVDGAAGRVDGCGNLAPVPFASDNGLIGTAQPDALQRTES